MKRYWFYGIMPRDTIEETRLTEAQKDIITKESNKITNENFSFGWLGYQRGNRWEFMRHGLESIFVEETRGNIAREMLIEILEEKYIKL